MTASPYFGREPFISWDKKKFVRILLFTGDKRDERIPDVPTLREIFDKEKVPESSRRVADVILAAESFGRPIFAGPGTAPEHTKQLRSAFEQALKDPELLAEAKQGGWMSIRRAAKISRSSRTGYWISPSDVIARVKKILSN